MTILSVRTRIPFRFPSPRRFILFLLIEIEGIEIARQGKKLHDGRFGILSRTDSHRGGHHQQTADFQQAQRIGPGTELVVDASYVHQPPRRPCIEHGKNQQDGSAVLFGHPPLLQAQHVE